MGNCRKDAAGVRILDQLLREQLRPRCQKCDSCKPWQHERNRKFVLDPVYAHKLRSGRRRKSFLRLSPSRLIAYRRASSKDFGPLVRHFEENPMARKFYTCIIVPDASRASQASHSDTSALPIAAIGVLSFFVAVGLGFHYIGMSSRIENLHTLEAENAKLKVTPDNFA